MIRIIGILLLLISLTSCSSMTSSPLPVAPQTKEPWAKREAALSQLTSWNITGKVALQTANDSVTANVTWLQQQQHRYRINLLGPLGAGGLTITGRPGLVTLVMSNGKQDTAKNAEDLLAAQWHFRLPVSSLYYWIRGLPVPGQPANRQFDSAGRLSSLTQQGTRIQYLSYTRLNGLDLPSKISVLSPSLKIKMIVYRWY